MGNLQRLYLQKTESMAAFILRSYIKITLLFILGIFITRAIGSQFRSIVIAQDENLDPDDSVLADKDVVRALCLTHGKFLGNLLHSKYIKINNAKAPMHVT